MAKVMAGAAAAVALLASPVEAGCWKADEAQAASVRTLQSMLMVAALRCEAAGHGIMADYNAFVLANKAAIASGNEKLKAHFIHALGPVAGQRGYDSFTTSLANGYGAGASGAGACADTDALAREATMMDGSIEGLLLIAERQGLGTALPEGACDAPPATLVIAVATPAAVTQAIAAAAAVVPAAETAPVAPAPVMVAAAASVYPVQQDAPFFGAQPPAPAYAPAPVSYPAPYPVYRPMPQYAPPQIAYLRPAPPQAAYAQAPGWGGPR